MLTATPPETSPTTQPAPLKRGGWGFPEVLVANGQALGCAVRHARSFLERGRGLLWRPRLEAGQALWILPCPSIHTVGMRYAIDVVFVSVDGRVLRIASNVTPMRFRLCKRAHSVLELASGQAALLGLAVGQQLSCVSANALSHKPPLARQ